MQYEKNNNIHLSLREKKKSLPQKTFMDEYGKFVMHMNL